MKKKLKISAISILMVFTVYNFLTITSAYGNTFDQLFSNYVNMEKWENSSEILHEELLAKAEVSEPADLWWSLWDPDKLGEQKAANALKLVDYLYPDGDISRWEEIKGLWYPSLIPTTLAAVDAVYVAAHELLEMDREGAAWLARNLVNDLGKSSRARHYFMKYGPEEYLQIITRLSDMGLNPDYGNWTEPHTTGTMRLANPVRGKISQNFAIASHFIFMNSSGQIVNLGTYAWDREKGRIYEVIDSERDDSSVVFLPMRW